MEETPEHGSLALGPPGRRFTDGFEVLYLTGDADATIVSVESVGGEEALEFQGALIAGPERAIGSWQQLDGYPPTEPGLGETVEADGAVIKPRDQTRDGIGYELLLGYEITDDEVVAARSEVRVTYEVDGTRFVHVSPAYLVYCPEAMTSEQCNSEAQIPGA